MNAFKLSYPFFEPKNTNNMKLLSVHLDSSSLKIYDGLQLNFGIEESTLNSVV
jgi:hypothetical protein